MKLNYNLISSIISLVRMYFRHGEQNIVNAENGAARLFCALISLYYTYHLFCGDKTMCVEPLHKEKGRKKRKKRGKESEGC